MDKKRERLSRGAEDERRYRVLPAILGVDVGAVLDQAPGDVDPAVEGGDVERGAVVVIPSVDEGGILLEELADGADVVLVGVPQDEGRPADPGLLLPLLLVGGPPRGRGGRGCAGAAGGIGAATAAAHGEGMGRGIGSDRIRIFDFSSSWIGEKGVEGVGCLGIWWWWCVSVIMVRFTFSTGMRFVFLLCCARLVLRNFPSLSLLYFFILYILREREKEGAALINVRIHTIPFVSCDCFRKEMERAEGLIRGNLRFYPNRGKLTVLISRSDLDRTNWSLPVFFFFWPHLSLFPI